MTDTFESFDALAYPPAQAAKVTGRSHTRIKKAIREKELTARKDGRATLIERAELQRWLGTLPTIGRKPDPGPELANGRYPLQKRVRQTPVVGARGRRKPPAPLIAARALSQ